VNRTQAYQRTSVENLIDDARYLAEELEALKSVIGSIPYNERPVQQDSILDMICRIGLIQRKFLKRAADQLNSSAKFESLPELPGNPALVISEKDIESLQQSNATEIIDDIIRERKELLLFFDRYLNKGEETRREKSDAIGRDYLHKLMYDLVSFERKQLKEAAERVLSIETDRN